MLIVRNPDPDSRLPYLVKLPLGEGLVLRTGGTWTYRFLAAAYAAVDHPDTEATRWPT